MNAASIARRRKGPKAARTGPVVARPGHRSRPGGNTAAAPVDQDDDGLAAALTCDVDVTRDPDETQGIVDDYPRVDAGDPDVPDEPVGTTGRDRR